jgi:hypothetical protein
MAEDNNDPPYHIHSCLWAGRAWYVPAENPSRIAFSKAYYFSECPSTNICWTDEGTTGDILGFLPGFGGLLVLKENSIWIIPQADSAAGYMAQLLIPDIGVVGADAAVFVNGVLWFADCSGIYTFNGESVSYVSEQLDGLERNVWDTNPRKTRAYYDKENWKVVFVCQGTAITFDSRTGAASLCGLPDTCYVSASSSDYSGALYGQDGMIMKECKGNMGLSLASDNYYTGSFYRGPLNNWERTSGDVDSNITDITVYWTYRGDSGSKVIGYEKTGIGSASSNYLGEGSVVGQTFTQWEKDSISVTRDYDIICKTIHFCNADDSIVFKSLPDSKLDEYYLGFHPMYYKGQYIYFDVDQSEKIVELLTVLFGDWVKGAWYSLFGTSEYDAEINECCPTFTVDYTAETLGENFTENNVTSGKEAFVEDRYFMRLPIQRKGYRGYFEILSEAFENIPPVKSLLLHYTILRERGGGRR